MSAVWGIASAGRVVGRIPITAKRLMTSRTSLHVGYPITAIGLIALDANDLSRHGSLLRLCWRQLWRGAGLPVNPLLKNLLWARAIGGSTAGPEVSSTLFVILACQIRNSNSTVTPGPTFVSSGSGSTSAPRPRMSVDLSMSRQSVAPQRNVGQDQRSKRPHAPHPKPDYGSASRGRERTTASISVRKCARCTVPANYAGVRHGRSIFDPSGRTAVTETDLTGSRHSPGHSTIGRN